jgi:hypothetical protein
MQILAMPYVEMHMQRYMAESRRTLVKNNRTMARRQHGLNSTASSGVGSAADLQGTMNVSTASTSSIVTFVAGVLLRCEAERAHTLHALPHNPALHSE